MLPLPEIIRKIPSLMPFLMLASGILVYSWFPEAGYLPYLGAGITLTLTILSRKKSGYTMGNRSCYMILLLYMYTGYILASIKDQPVSYPGEGFYVAEVISLPEYKKNSLKYKLRLLGKAGDTISWPKNFKFYAYIEKDSSRKMPVPGNKIICKAKLTPVMPTGNPEAFDYGKYLKRSQIYSSCYFRGNTWELLPTPPNSAGLLFFSLKIKQNIQERIRETGEKTGLNSEIMLAICTGEKGNLERETLQSFSGAGAIHIMAVSGLHVGMIWSFLSSLTFFLKRKKTLKIIQFTLIISCLWMFAIMTGLPPSILRACIMFSIASFSTLIKRQSFVFNTLVFSANVQVLINPNVIFSVGFQFSYLAVLSILLFQPIVKNFIPFQWVPLRWISGLLSVSISAQILTFPLAILYFHQFPVYFLLSNLLIIPLVTLVMICFLSSLSLIFIPWIFTSLTHLSLIFCKIIHWIVIIINNLPFSTLNNLQLTWFQALLILLLPLILLVYYYYKKFTAVILACTLFILFQLSAIYYSEKKDPNQICIFNIKGHTAIDLSYYGAHILIHDLSPEEMHKLDYAAREYWVQNFSKLPEIVHIDSLKKQYGMIHLYKLPGKSNMLISTGSGKYLILTGPGLQSYKTPESLSIDKIILRKQPYGKNMGLTNIFLCKKLILDSSVPAYLIKNKENDSLFFSQHYVGKDGAYIGNP